MMHYCREELSTILEINGLLPELLLDHFNESHFLYDDIVKEDKLKEFKNYIYSLIDVENEYGKIVEHRIVMEEISNKDSKRFNLIFTKGNGVYIGTDITRYPYKIIHNELGIKKCRFYDLRGSSEPLP